MRCAESYLNAKQTVIMQVLEFSFSNQKCYYYVDELWRTCTTDNFGNCGDKL